MFPCTNRMRFILPDFKVLPELSIFISVFVHIRNVLWKQITRAPLLSQLLLVSHTEKEQTWNRSCGGTWQSAVLSLPTWLPVLYLTATAEILLCLDRMGTLQPLAKWAHNRDAKRILTYRTSKRFVTLYWKNTGIALGARIQFDKSTILNWPNPVTVIHGKMFVHSMLLYHVK